MIVQNKISDLICSAEQKRQRVEACPQMCYSLRPSVIAFKHQRLASQSIQVAKRPHSTRSKSLSTKDIVLYQNIIIMEIPKMRRMRRQASLHPRFGTLQRTMRMSGRSGSSVVLNKSNPYVGWFRHAPSTTGASFVDDFQTKALQMKKSPFIGWFRHSPPTRFKVHNKKRIAAFESHLKALLAMEERRMKLFKVDGCLRGGAPASWLDCQTIKRTLLDPSASGSESATIQVLSRLATWFLFPLAHDQSSCGYRHHPELTEKEVVDFLPRLLTTTASPEESDDGCSTITDDDGSSSDESDSSCYSIGTHLQLSRAQQAADLSQTVSSLAEAYYAFQAADGLDRTLTLSDNDSDRLDYAITQIDIARMARNASRHLDVESIYALPTITFQSDPTPDPDFGQETGSSWMLVAPAQEDECKNDDSQVCVICLDHFQDGDRLRVLPCSHCFHVGCIDRWLSGSKSYDECYTSGCPTCKKRPETETAALDGSVPSWAFAKLGDALAKGTSLHSSSYSLSS